MTTATNRILAVLVLGISGAALPIPGEGLSRESDRAGILANRFSFGMWAGANQTPSASRTVVTYDRWTNFARNQSAGWLVGGFAEMDLGARFSVQAGLSYVSAHHWRRIEDSQDASEIPGWSRVITVRDRIDPWELSVTLKYRLGSAKWHPVIGGGPAMRERWPIGGNYGVVALFGMEGRVGRHWTVAPQVRYFRWGSVDSPFGSIGRPRDRIQALVAVMF